MTSFRDVIIARFPTKDSTRPFKRELVRIYDRDTYLRSLPAGERLALINKSRTMKPKARG